jgi:hypothetical protein
MGAYTRHEHSRPRGRAPRAPSTTPGAGGALALLAALVAAQLATPHRASAAWETEVLTAAEKDNAFDLHLTVGFAHSVRGGKIVREWIQPPSTPEGRPQALDVKELRVLERKNELRIGLRVGLYHDLELHISAPIVLAQDSVMRYALGAQSASTVAGSINADDPNFTGGTPRFPLTDVPDQRFRDGFGDMTFGLSWSPFVEHKDEAWPTLTLRGDITAPTGSVRTPTELEALTNAAGGGVGLGQTLFDLSIGVSRRMREGTPAIDPYVQFGVTLPAATASLQDLGMEPPVSGRFVVGAELIGFDDPVEGSRVALDVSFETRYTGTGRTFSELSDYLPSFDPTRVLGNRSGPITQPDQFEYADFANARNYASQVAGARCGKVEGVPCGELNQVEEYVTFGGTVAALFQITRYAFLRGGVALRHDTDHFLTNERVGTDLDPPTDALCDGARCSGRVNARNSTGKDERSPYYDPRYDAPGRRFRLEENTHWTFFVSGGATF